MPRATLAETNNGSIVSDMEDRRWEALALDILCVERSKKPNGWGRDKCEMNANNESEIKKEIVPDPVPRLSYPIGLL